MSKKEDIEFMISDLGFLTGSRAWGIESHHSDWDYIYTMDHFAIVKDTIFSNKDLLDIPISESLYYKGYVFGLNGKSYNIFILPTIEYHTWVEATKLMRVLCDDLRFTKNFNLKEDKRKRLAIFENLRSNIKLLI